MDAQSREQSHKDTIAHSKKINWEVNNFPPCLKIVHYDLSELSGKVRTFSQVPAI